MSIISRITDWLRRGEHNSLLASPPSTTIQEMPAPTSATPTTYANMGVARDRATLVRECCRLYKSDARVKRLIKDVARDVVKGGFVVKVEDNPDAERIANELVQRLGLRSRLDDWVRLTMRDGDSFIEIGVDAQNRIALATRKPTLEMRRNSDECDLFPDPLRAFWWADEATMLFGDDLPRDAVVFARWQIIHARWEHDEGNRYGTPMFAEAVESAKRMREGEFDMAVRRKTRAGMKFLHVVEGASSDELEAYKLNNQDALNNPFAAVADFFSNKSGSIQSIQGDARLGEFSDVMHHVRTFALGSPMPLSLAGYGQDLNRDVLEDQRRQYERALEQIGEWVEEEFVRPLLELQWLLAGMLPETLNYTVVWSTKDKVTAADIGAAADAAIKLRALGLDEATVLQIIAPFVPNVDLMAAAKLTPGASGGQSAQEASASGIAFAAQAAIDDDDEGGDSIEE